jgi:hypothetical protein
VHHVHLSSLQDITNEKLSRAKYKSTQVRIHVIFVRVAAELDGVIIRHTDIQRVWSWIVPDLNSNSALLDTYINAQSYIVSAMK